jgi:outer membrane protein assembly factor BamB
MRTVRSLATLGLLLVAMVAADHSEIVKLFEARRTGEPNAVYTSSSQALLTEDIVYFNIFDTTTNVGYSCGYNTTMSQFNCQAAVTGAIFDTQPIMAEGASLHPVGSAFTFTKPSQAAVQSSTVVYWAATGNVAGQGVPQPRSYTAPGVLVSIAALGPGQVGVRYKRNMIAGTPPQYMDQVAIHSIVSNSFVSLWSLNTTLPVAGAGQLTAAAQQIVNMENILVFIQQTANASYVVFINSTNPTTPLFKIPTTVCGIEPKMGSVGIAKVAYDAAPTGEVLNALLIFGTNTSMNTVVCRLSHHTGKPTWTAVFPNFILSGRTFRGGNGHIVVNGLDKAGDADWIGVLHGDSGNMTWTQQRLTTDANSEPVISGATVFFQCNGVLCSRDIFSERGNVETRTTVSCPRTPAVSGKRVYCVTGTNQLFAFSPLTNQIIWQTTVQWQNAPQIVPNSNNIVATVTTQGTVVAVDNQLVPDAPTTAAPGGAPAPGDDDSDKATVTGLIVVIVLLVIAGIAVVVFYARRQRSRRTAVFINGDDTPGAPPTPKGDHGLYGSA